MQAFAIPRVDPGSEGIEVLWTWPDTLPLSADGYDLLRLDSREIRWEPHCETIGPSEIAALRAQFEITAPLGPLRLRHGAKITTISAHLPTQSDVAGDHNTLTVAPAQAQVPVHAAPLIAAAAATGQIDPHAAPFVAVPGAAAGQIDEFIQELTVPADRATVVATASAVLAIGLARGKAVASGMSGASPASILLSAAGIDTIVVYTVALRTMTICTYAVGKDDEASWARATVVAKGLTLPIRECDPPLTTHPLEYAKAQSRLVGAETLDQSRFDHMADTLRAPAAAGNLGRNGARLSLNRADATQSYEEMAFEQQLTALVLHPKARRVLGFGHHDRAGLVPGRVYRYRVIGRFESADMDDTIYDVHRIPGSTVLPDNFWIGDVGFRFQTSVKVVQDPPPSGSALNATSRRGIRVDTTGYDASWLTPSYGGWSALIALPQPVTRLVLEVAPGHTFNYAAGLPWAFGSPPPPLPLPAGPIVELTFTSPVLELRLSGVGTFYALRLPSGAKGIVEVHADTQQVVYAGVPLPAPPLVLALTNLQQPTTTINGDINESTPVPPRQPVGFRLTWLPAALNNVPVWPDDLESGPPLDALAYAIEHRRVTLPATFGPWEPINADDNLTLGSRDLTAPDVRLEQGCDLNALFPTNRPRENAGLSLTFSDVFGEKDPTTGITRPAQPLGSYHQYRIRAVDAAGRISATETLSNIARLEKHIPPPLPTSPQPPAVDGQGNLTGPAGPRARAIVKNAPGLTAADIATLGTHQNAIVLEWGWRQEERDIDPTATEFRVYLTQPPDKVTGTITAVSSASPYWQVTLTTDLPLVADELVGQWITSGGYPFLIVHNSAGNTPSLQVEHAVKQPLLQPQPGPVVFGRPLRAEHQQPRGWSQRVAVYPLTAADSYRHVFYDVLTLSVAHPRDAVWVGVSAADAQGYVPDQRATGTFANRPGNESGIAPCGITERYRGQPVFSMPPPLGDVPELVTEEPTGRQVLVTLDLAALVGGGLPAGSRVALERCSADEVISRTSVSGSNVVLTQPDGTQQTIPFPNPSDSAAVLAALNGPTPQRLANRYLMHLLAASMDPEAFFTRPSAHIETLGPVTDRLAPKPGRFLYFLRAADALGNLSSGGALLPTVVRVPSIAGAATPVRRSLSGAAGNATLTVAVAPDPDTTVLLLFAAITPPHTMPESYPDAELLRVPNRRDLYPNDGIRLRLSNGALLSPASTLQLADPSVTVEADGTRVATLSLTAGAGAWVTLWCFALTRDGQPSRVCGPFGQGVAP
jgi:hypothetical protein